jgi:hypothetical protein
MRFSAAEGKDVVYGAETPSGGGFMRNIVILLGLAALGITGCAVHDRHDREFVRHATLTQAEAHELVEAYIARDVLELRAIRAGQPQDWGHLFFYDSPFLVDQQPPKTTHIFSVYHDGSVRQWRPEDAE